MKQSFSIDNSEIRITRLATGWVVELPGKKSKQESPFDVESLLKEILKELTPYMNLMFGKLRKEVEHDEPEEKVTEQEQTIFVFPSLEYALDFLVNKYPGL